MSLSLVLSFVSLSHCLLGGEGWGGHFWHLSLFSRGGEKRDEEGWRGEGIISLSNGVQTEIQTDRQTESSVEEHSLLKIILSVSYIVTTSVESSTFLFYLPGSGSEAYSRISSRGGRISYFLDLFRKTWTYRGRGDNPLILIHIS